MPPRGLDAGAADVYTVQGGRQRAAAPVRRRKPWGATMPLQLNVLRAMQSIQDGISEALVIIEAVKLSSGESELLDQCTVILRTTWEVANDYEAALPKIVERTNSAPHVVAAEPIRDSTIVDGGSADF